MSVGEALALGFVIAIALIALGKLFDAAIRQIVREEINKR